MNSVLARPGTHNENRVVRAFGYCFDRLTVTNNPCTHGIDQRVDLKAIVKKHFPAHRRNSKGIAVIAYAPHDAPH